MAVLRPLGCILKAAFAFCEGYPLIRSGSLRRITGLGDLFPCCGRRNQPSTLRRSLRCRLPRRKLAYIAALNANGRGLNRTRSLSLMLTLLRKRTVRSLGRVDMPKVGAQLHHFGWNACSSALCPYAPHPHVERRYLVVPGLSLFADSHHRHQAPILVTPKS